MKYYNVQPEAWAPLGGGRHKPFENNLLQVLQMPIKIDFSGHSALEYSAGWSLFEINTSTAYRRKFCYLGFLTDREMAQISSLDLGYVGESVKHFNPEFVRGCLAVKYMIDINHLFYLRRQNFFNRE